MVGVAPRPGARPRRCATLPPCHRGFGGNDPGDGTDRRSYRRAWRMAAAWLRRGSAGRGTRMIVAVDGPAASGKGTLARRLAYALNLAYLDTGQIYRAVAARLLAHDSDPANPAAAAAEAARLTADDLARPDLRDERVSQAASIVAAIPAVRQALLGFQRDFATTSGEGYGGAVLDGRDIGTVVCPDADAKIFITASPAVR